MSVTGTMRYLTIGDSTYEVYNTNDDTKVYQSYKTASEYTYWRPLLIGYSSGSAETFTPGDQTNLAYTFSTLKVQPSTGTIRVGALSIYNGSYTATLDTTTLTDNRAITIPNKAGTIALISDLPDISGKIDTAGTGLSKSGTTLNHSNSITAQTTQAVYPIKIDAQGHISAYGSAVTIPTVPSATGSSTTGISIADHSSTSIYGVSSSTTSVTGVSGSTSVYGVKSGTNSTTTASKASGANGTAPSWTFEEKSIPNVTSAGSASSWTFEEKTIPNVTSAGSASSWTFEEKSIPNVTAAGSGSASLTFTMDTTDTKKLKIAFSHTHTAPTLGTAITVQSKSGGSNGTAPTLGTAIKVQSKSGGSNGSAPTLGTEIKVQSKSGGSNGSASTWSFTDVTVPIRADSATTVPTAASSATTVPIKNGTATTVVTSKTHSVTDNGHTHTI